MKAFNKNRFSIHTIMLIGLVLIFMNACKDDNNNPTPAKETGTVTDVDNNVYQTIKIGNQWWMSENLKVTKFRNGNIITNAQSNADWSDTTSAYCLYDNNSSAPGLLYNWYAVNDTANLAPQGWHIATDDEWKTLEKQLGMSQTETDKLSWRGNNEADKLKVESPNGWTIFGNIWSTNESGFSALAGGCRLFNGTWANPGLFATGFWWTSTAHADNEAYYRYLDYKSSQIFRSHVPVTYGMSVRCVKD
jgi:uncharacterized protein (TIGR02145 family)